MSKRILSLLLALAMVIGMTVPAVYADETETTPEKTPAQIGAEIAAAANAMEFPESGNVVKYCPVCEKEVTWSPIKTNATSWVGTGTSSHLYVPTDLTIESSKLSTSANGALLESAGELCLHLNGKRVEVLGANVFNFGRAGSVGNVMGNGTVIGNPAGQLTSAISITSGAEVNLYGGTYTKGETASEKAPVFQLGSTANEIALNIYGTAEINGAGVVNKETPGCLYLVNETAVVNMYGGKITNGKSESSVGGGNVRIKSGEFNMYGGEITNGINTYKQAKTGDANGGGNVAVYGTDSRLNVYAGTISGGITNSDGGNIFAYNGGAVYLGSGAVVCNGKSQNAITSTGGGGNVCILGAAATLLADVGSQIYGGTGYNGKDISAIYGANIELRGTVGTEGTATTDTKTIFLQQKNGGTQNTMTVNGATIHGGFDSVRTAVVFNDGTMNGTVSLRANTPSPTLKIYHGTYSFDPAIYLASGAVAVAGEGIYTVHQPVDKEASEATCTQPGKAAHVGCSGCDKAFADATCAVEINVADATKPAHTQTPVEATPSTCTVAGNKAYFACECGKNYADEACENEIADLVAWKTGEGALELAKHAYVYEYKSATAHTVSCENCETVFEDGVHDTTADSCARCGAKKIMLKIAGVQAPAGNWTNTKDAQIFTMGMWSGVTNVPVAYNEGNIVAELYSGETLLMTSTMTKGAYNGKAYFVLDGESEYWTTELAEGVVLSEETIPTKAVLYVDGVKVQNFVGANNATTGIFNEAQYKAYLQMSKSGHVHTLNEGEETTPASCTAPGELTKTCSVCDGTVKTPIEQLNHSYTGENGVCVNGCENTVCTNEGHNWGEEIAAKGETCIAKGNVAYYDCANCDAYAVGEEKVITAWNEIEIAINAEKHSGAAVLDETTVKAPSCYEEGNTGDKKCPGCQAVVEEGEPIPTVAHTIKYKDITDTHHTAYCEVKECTVYEEVPAEHVYENGACVCGKEEPVTAEGEAVFGDQAYATVQAALDAAAVNGGTVVLNDNAAMAELWVPTGVTLDLNGKTLTITDAEAYVACFTKNCFIIDTSDDNSGRLVADKEQLRLLKTNGYLPVEMNGGIMFVEATAAQGKNPDTNYQCWLNSVDAALVNALKENTASELGLKFQVILTWGEGTNSLQYTFKDETVAKYMADWENLAMQLKVSGAEGINDLTYQFRVVFGDQAINQVAVWTAEPVAHN